MNKFRWLLLIAGTVFGFVFAPHLFRIPYPSPAEGQMFLAGKPYDTAYVDYASLFARFDDFARHQIEETHRLPLWDSSALLGLPTVEESDHCILNPVQWVNWLGGQDWRTFVSSLCLSWAAWGLFLVLTRCMRHSRRVSFACSILYALAGTAPHALGYFSCLMHLMCLPHILYHAAQLLSRPRSWSGNFLWLVAYVTLILLTGQPQFLLVSGLFVAVLLTSLMLLSRSPGTLLLYISAGIVSLLLAAPAIAPFLQANLSGMAYEGNHQLVGSSSFWKINLMTLSQLVCGRLTGLPDLPWYSSTNPSLALSYEGFPIALGVVSATAALAGALAGLRYAFRARHSSTGMLRAAVSIAVLLLLALLVYHNLSQGTVYPWFFHFVNLDKYSTPVLALLFCLAIPGGLGAFVASTAPVRVVFCLAAILIPTGFLALIHHDGGAIANAGLMAYSLVITIAPVLALCFAALVARRQPGFPVTRVVAAALLLEALLLCTWGVPLPFEWGRVAALAALAAGFLLLSGQPARLKTIVFVVSAACIGALIAVRENSAWVPTDFSRYEELAAFAKNHKAKYGYRPRFLTSESLVRYPDDGVFGLRAVVSRCPVIPLATQGLLFDYIDPGLLARTQRRYSFLEFHGAVAPGTSGYLSWPDFAEHPRLLDLLGVDYLVDFSTGWLAKNRNLFQETFGAEEPIGSDLYSRGRLNAAGLIWFSPRFATEAFAPDGWNVRRRLRDEDAALSHVPIVEIDSRRVPQWEGFVQHQWFEAPQRPAAVYSVAYRTDRDGLLEADITTDGPGLLVYKEQFWPGWVAYVNGAPTPVLRVNSIFQGVLLKAGGTSRIRFEYVGTLGRDIGISAFGLVLATIMAALLRHYSKLRSLVALWPGTAPTFRG